VRPSQTEQPAIDIPPSPRIRADLYELDLAGADGNLLGPSHVTFFFMPL
jgi:hypothetical protein